MASNAKTRRLDCGAAVDRIINLPRNLKHLILDRLPIDDVVSTSFLFKAWRDIWIMHPNLVFDNQFFSQLVSKKFPMEDKHVQLSEVSKTISNILLLHSGPILIFDLTVPPYLPLHQCMDIWIRNISNNGVRILKLFNRAPIAYKIPSYLFSCSELTHLWLAKCILNPPLKFGGFCNLINVKLVMVRITDDMSFGTQLKHLSLTNCSGVEHLGSHFKNCNNMTELIIIQSEEIDWRLLECTPKMQLNTLGLVLGRVTNVTKRVINLDMLFSNMPRIKTLYLDGFFLESFKRDAARVKRPITTLEKLNLECVQLENLVCIHNALCLIRSFPNLRHLRLRLLLFVLTDSESSEEFGFLMMSIIRATEVNSSDDMDSLDPSVLSMTPRQVKTVEILETIGSVTELQFVKLLLASLPSLKWIKLKMAIHDPGKELAILR
ncbi:F-box domain-containing protein [Heracleum sosnowskyi]|uniref:F-box domain-containing protein n=1 Tax=Heracleum sosnowskyi TaxID=360622 RepID=A0AAD8HP55_9APIA|nr:F-box domain-containing protein [Heracleum sosnowskyi]